jgi:hypothetical protein
MDSSIKFLTTVFISFSVTQHDATHHSAYQPELLSSRTVSTCVFSRGSDWVGNPQPGNSPANHKGCVNFGFTNVIKSNLDSIWIMDCSLPVGTENFIWYTNFSESPIINLIKLCGIALVNKLPSHISSVVPTAQITCYKMDLRQPIYRFT